MADVNPLLGETAAAAVENAAERQFGPEFEDIHILSNAQVAVILQVSARSAVNRDEELNEVYRKTQKYVERFNTMTNPEKDHQELVDELDNLQEYVPPPQIRNIIICVSARLLSMTRSSHLFSSFYYQCLDNISKRNGRRGRARIAWIRGCGAHESGHY
jgi:DNA-directed RNA polymerase subunit F